MCLFISLCILPVNTRITSINWILTSFAMYVSWNAWWNNLFVFLPGNTSKCWTYHWASFQIHFAVTTVWCLQVDLWWGTHVDSRVWVCVCVLALYELFYILRFVVFGFVFCKPPFILASSNHFDWYKLQLDSSYVNCIYSILIGRSIKIACFVFQSEGCICCISSYSGYQSLNNAVLIYDP